MTKPRPFPQLRVRTEFSFKQAFGPLPRVASALAALRTGAAGIVDPGTWGHVKWAKALKPVGVGAMFGTELTVALADGRKPKAWALAEDTAGFYQFSTAARAEDADVAQEFARARGCVRFAGAALTNPECFDYVDLNPASALQQQAALALAKHTGRPLVVTSDNAYPALTDYPAFMAIGGGERMTPQHILSAPELCAALPCLSKAQWLKAVSNTREAAERCATVLPTAPLIKVPGDLRALAAEGKARRIRLGHIPNWDAAYDARLARELDAVEAREFQSYFLVVSDLVTWAKERMLVGPGRGSSAGSLLCYCIDITEVDPIPHQLLFERFIDLTRKDLPDIDLDFNDKKRDSVFDYLSEKYSPERVARVGSINTMKPRSVLHEICKRFQIPDHEKFDLINVLIEHSSGDSRYGKGLEDTLTQTAIGRAFMERNPTAAIMGEVENHASHAGVHAAGVIVCNEPISTYCTVGPGGVAHIDKPDAEALNLLKIDALGLRTLGIIEDAGVVTANELYALKLDDPAVLKIFNDRKYAALFQFEGQSQRTISAQVDVDSFKTVDHLTALSRPGPLGSGAAHRYITRKNNVDEWTEEPHEKYIRHIFAETYGVVLYQEQVMRIVREIGKFSWEETTVIRKAMSGRKGKEYFDLQEAKFIVGAAQDDISAADAHTIWVQICSFGAWGMNASHTCAYAMISYWCAWMKAYHPLAYAASCLRNAKDDEQVLAILREVTQEGIDYAPFDFATAGVSWEAREGRIVGGFTNIKGIGPAKATKAIADSNAGRMTAAAKEKILAMPLKFTELYPLHKQFGDVYLNPEAHGCREGSRVLTQEEMPEEGEVLYMGTVHEKEMRDMNETVRVGRRGGRVITGPTAFADIVLLDDSAVPMICRINRFRYDPLGKLALERLIPGKDVLLVRGKKIKYFPLIDVERMRCLTNPDALK